MFDEQPAEAVSTKRRGYCEVIHVAAAAVVAGEDGGGELGAAANDGAETVVAFQDAFHLFPCFVGADAGAGVPEGEDLVVVGDGHGE